MTKTQKSGTTANSAGAAASPPAVSPPIEDLPLPRVRNASANSTLYPMTSITGTDVIITAAVASGVEITVYWAVLGQEHAPLFTAKAEGNGSADVHVPVPAWVVGFCIGKTTTIWYRTPTQSSLRLELTVEVIKPEEMPKPEFLDLTPNGSDRWLDMKEFYGNARIKLCGWPFIADGQLLWVEASSNEHLTPRRFHWILENHRVTEVESQKGFCFVLEILREWLANNVDWSSVTIQAGVTYDGAPGTPPKDPSISHLPENAHEFQRTTTVLRLGNPALRLLPPTLREATYIEGQGYVLNPVNTVNGAHLIVAYDGISPGHKVCVNIKGAPGPGSPELACKVVQSGQTSVVFDVPPSAISANFDNTFVASYTVLSGDVLWPSPELPVKVLALTDLEGIDVDERTGDKLCLNTFTGDATARVARWDYAAPGPGQTCWLHIVGEYEDGRLFHWTILEAEPVKPEWVSGGVSALLSREQLEALADCHEFKLCFAVDFRGSEVLANAVAFRPLTLHMVQASLVLQPPSVLEAVGNVLTIWNGRAGVTARVGYKRISRHHKVCLTWDRGDGTSLSLGPEPGDSDLGHVDFKIPREEVIRAAGKAIPISYSVTSACQQASSGTLELEVSIPVLARRPALRVHQAACPPGQRCYLDLGTFEGDINVFVKDPGEDIEKAWWFILEDQIAYMTCTGPAEDGSPHTISIMHKEPIKLDDLNRLSRTVLREEFERFKDGAELTLRFKCTTDQSQLESDAHEFQTLTLLFKKAIALPAPHVPEANDGVLDFLQLCCEKDAHLVVNPWTRIATDNQVSLSCTGSTVGGGQHSVELLRERPVTPSEVQYGLNIAITNAQLASFANGSEITLQLNVRFPNDALRPFDPVSLKLIKSRQIIERFDGQPNKLLKSGESIRLSTMTITMVQLAAHARGGIYTYGTVGDFMSGPAFGLCIDANGSIIPAQITRFAFIVPCACLRFAYVHLDGKATVRFYGESGALMETRIVDSAKGGRHQWVEFKAGKGKLLASFEVEVGEHGYLDNFTMCSVVDA
ncbi:hypothetical protein [Pseudomonas orientalis]|uniref:Uncharacterized protein n=1 Tax=Pseudomonas orientalis TaxID=76758 RepID=A0A8B3XVY2_9PSED|nr:hypothetical protein [Pseudomonas orientalis]SDU00453.1 hypothetical protein SAMN04490197_1911 [Pseudomonas orientalis]